MAMGYWTSDDDGTQTKGHLTFDIRLVGGLTDTPDISAANMSSKLALVFKRQAEEEEEEESCKRRLNVERKKKRPEVERRCDN